MIDRPGCAAYRVSDQMMCPLCRFIWDVNDGEPPACGAGTRTQSVSPKGHATRAIASHRWRRRFDYGPNVMLGYRKRLPWKRNPNR